MCRSLVDVGLWRTLVGIRWRLVVMRLVHGHGAETHLRHGSGELICAVVRLRHMRIGRGNVRDGVRARHAVLLLLLRLGLLLLDNGTWTNRRIPIITSVCRVVVVKVLVALRRSHGMLRIV